MILLGIPLSSTIVLMQEHPLFFVKQLRIYLTSYSNDNEMFVMNETIGCSTETIMLCYANDPISVRIELVMRDGAA